MTRRAARWGYDRVHGVLRHRRDPLGVAFGVQAEVILQLESQEDRELSGAGATLQLIQHGRDQTVVLVLRPTAPDDADRRHRTAPGGADHGRA